MNWLITGGCGFIGTGLIKMLLKEKIHNIRIIDNLTTGTKEDLLSVCEYKELKIGRGFSSPLGVELVVGDILDQQLADQISNNIDVTVHLAANTGVGPSVEDPRADFLSNVVGTFNYLEAARINNVSRFIFSSSGAPAGEVEPPIHEELPPHPVSPYGASKLAGEGYCSAYSRTFGLDTVCLRFGNVYGPGSIHKNSIVAKFIRSALNGETLEIYGDGSQTRDFIYIDDLLNAIILASNTNGVGGEVFQIASNHETTVGDIAGKLVELLSHYCQHKVKVTNGKTRLGDVKRNYSNISKARDILKWRPYMSQEEGLKKTIEYFYNEKV